MMRIVSLNIAGYGDWEARQPQIIDFLNRHQPAVVMLQEVKFDPRRSAFNQAMQLNQQLTSPFRYSQSTVASFTSQMSVKRFAKVWRY
jgi:exonuclease III